MNLVITTISDYNYSALWAGGSFDMLLIDYKERGCYKYEGIAEELNKGLICYDYFFMPDEDILLSSCDIDKIFALMMDFGLSLAQPSIDPNSNVSFKRFKHAPGADVIYTDFVEIMCPAFSKEALLACLPTFTKSKSGWGLDLAWSKILGGKNMAILNGVVAQHTRPVGGGELYARLKREGITPSVERKRLMKEYGVTEEEVRRWRQ